jgi:hypothetical protein
MPAFVTKPVCLSLSQEIARYQRSIPKLKRVRMASVGILTMASPRRLKEAFITTGTPVRLPEFIDQPTDRPAMTSGPQWPRAWISRDLVQN